MSARSSFPHALAWLILLLLVALPAGGALSAPADPIFPQPARDAPEGYYLFGENQVSTPITPTDPDRFAPESAYDPDNGRFLVVWHQTYPSGHAREIYGQLVSSDGTKYGSPIVITTGTYDRVQPAVAYNGVDHEFLVVYMQDVNGDGLKYDIRGQRVSSSGALLGVSFEIITWENRSFWSPRIAWNSIYHEYMVVWGALAQNTQIATDIAMKVLSPAGEELWSWIITTEGFPTNPDINFDPVNDRYLVVWNYLNTSGKNVIRGSLRDDAGNEIRPVDIYGSTTNESLNPRVSSSLGIFYSVVWEYDVAVNDHDIYVGLVNADATGVIAAPLVDGTTHDTHPDVAGSSDRWEYMITFQRADVNGAKVLMRPFSNYLSDDIVDICNYVFTDCILPSIEFGGATFMNSYVIDVSTMGPEGNQPSNPVSVQHVYDRPFNTGVIYLPVIIK